MFITTYPVSSEGGSSSFQNNVPDPVTSGAELPTFKFELAPVVVLVESENWVLALAQRLSLTSHLPPMFM
jgi:hypothetical protein